MTLMRLPSAPNPLKGASETAKAPCRGLGAEDLGFLPSLVACEAIQTYCISLDCFAGSQGRGTRCRHYKFSKQEE
jgi:hypothetical protein